MAVTFFPFNSMVIDGVPDRPANAENLAAYLAGFFSNGVLMQTDAALKVEASSGMNVQIHAGMGNINGKTILADAAEIITLDPASASLGRIDRVVFRLDEANRLMEFDVLKGTPASNPTAPALKKGADVYEMCLAEISVPAGVSTILASHIKDTRADEMLCGAATIPPHMQDMEHGGTGISAKTKEALLAALGGISGKVLWENSSPTSSYGSNTEIYADEETISDKDLVAACFRQSTSSSTEIWAFGQIGKTSRASIGGRVAHADDEYSLGLSRVFTPNESSIEFNSGSRTTTIANATTTGTVVIPQKVIVLKGVLI